MHLRLSIGHAKQNAVVMGRCSKRTYHRLKTVKKNARSSVHNRDRVTQTNRVGTLKTLLLRTTPRLEELGKTVVSLHSARNASPTPPTPPWPV